MQGRDRNETGWGSSEEPTEGIERWSDEIQSRMGRVLRIAAPPILLLLTSVGSASAQGGGGAPVSPWMSQLFLFGSFGLIFYFLILRPQQRRQRAMREMLDSLKSGDRVVTSGGMIGTITDLKEDRVTLKIANDVKADFTKASITAKVES